MKRLILVACTLTYFTISRTDPLSAGDAQVHLEISLTNKTRVELSFAGEVGYSYRILTNSNPVGVETWNSLTNMLGNGNILRTETSLQNQRGFFAVHRRANALYGMNFFVDTNSSARKWADANRPKDPTNSVLMDKIAAQPVAMWLTGAESNTYVTVAARMQSAIMAQQVPVFTLYNIPHRDCGNYSSGGAVDGTAYTNWISSIAFAISNNRAVLILEPDALPNLNCPALSAADREDRIALIARAIQILKKQCLATVYVDAGHPGWQSPDTMVRLLSGVDIQKADGFALNVSNFAWDKDVIDYGTSISARLQDIHFVIDSSRNGLGPSTDPDLKEAWCNPPGRALGRRPTTSTEHPLVDAYLWIKVPGESDGQCRFGAPVAGAFWPEYALELSANASY